MRFINWVLAASFLTVGFVGAVLAQNNLGDDQYGAPILWTQFKIPGLQLSFAFPKLPVVRSNNDQCSQTNSEVYTAYADQTVYQLGWFTKSNAPVPKACGPTEQFGQQQYLRRLKELRAGGAAIESDVKIMASPAKMFRIEREAIVDFVWLLWDIDRWFEIAVTRRKDGESNEDRLLSSITLSDSSAIEIGTGSQRIRGDKADMIKRPLGKEVPDTEGLFVLSKPRPGYTDEARSRNTQGTVVLLVTFLANGSIGAVTPVKELENGLTEQTIAAAQRIAFLPARAKGVPVTVTKQIEYSFSIY